MTDQAEWEHCNEAAARNVRPQHSHLANLLVQEREEARAPLLNEIQRLRAELEHERAVSGRLAAELQNSRSVAAELLPLVDRGQR